MKKKLLFFILLLIIAAASINLFIPAKIHVSQAQYFSVPPNSIDRCFNRVAQRRDWWPSREGLEFSIPDISSAAIQPLIIRTGISDTVNSYISSNQLPNDSSFIYWECTVHAGWSPLDRVRQYLKAKKIKQSMDSVLDAFSRYAAVTSHIYELPIERVKVKDTLLITVKKTFNSYPAVTDIYDLIHSLEHYTQQQHATQNGFPMLHIFPAATSQYDVMVGLPINKVIPETDNNKIKRLLYNGNLLMVPVRGDSFSINQGFSKLDNYKEDYHLIAPAIPYQSLVTDRSKEPDTTRWQTNLYFPFY